MIHQQKVIQYEPIDAISVVKLMADNNIYLNQYAKILLDNLPFNDVLTSEKICIYELDLCELNIIKPANYFEILTAVKENGFHPCPLLFAPFIRLAYGDQTNSDLEFKNEHPDDAILIVSDLLKNKEDFPKGFYIRAMNSKLWLRGYICSDDYCWPCTTRIIVCR